MNTTYTAKNLAAVAVLFRQRAKDCGDRAERAMTKRAETQLLAEKGAWETAASIVDSTTLDECTTCAKRRAVKTYTAPSVGFVTVKQDGEPDRKLDRRLDLANHSPDGFSWGYAGSGCAQLALALLADVMEDDGIAVRLHQQFKFAVITPMPITEPFKMTSEEVLAHVAKIANVRWVPTYVGKDGLRTLVLGAQGRWTFDTKKEAQAWCDAARANNSADSLAQIYGPGGAESMEPRACECWPGHNDPKGVYFD